MKSDEQYLAESKRFCVRWATYWGLGGIVGILLLALILSASLPFAVEMLIGSVVGFAIGMGLGQPVVAWVEYRKDVRFIKERQNW